jgi:membrane-bound lytic murein transglycosylase D
MHLAMRSEELGITPVQVDPWEPVDTVLASNPVRLGPVAQVLGLPIARLRHINPTLCGDEVMAGTNFFLPRGEAVRFAQLTDSIVRMQREAPPVVAIPEAVVEVERTITYRVRPGDNLGSIAHRHKVTVAQLKKWNGLRSDRINADAKLTIHQRVKQPVKVPAEANPEVPEENGPVNSVPQRPTDDISHVSYTVQPGDSLYDIARRFPGVTASDIMQANGITAHIRPGQEIKIPRP